MPNIKMIILFLFGITTGTIAAQNLAIKQYTIDDGLPSNTVYDVFFDSKGYLWMATDKGIVRYNGIEFKIFTSNDGMPDNENFGFNEDSEGRLWICNFKGICFYKDNVFHTAANTPWLKLKSKVPANYFHRASLQNDSSLILMSVNGESMLLIKDQTLKEVALKAVMKIFAPTGQHPLLVKKINRGQIKLFYDHKAITIDEEGNVLKVTPYKDTSSHFIITSLHDDNYIGAKNLLYNYNEKIIASFPKDGPVFPGFFRSIRFAGCGNIFSLSRYGLFYNNQRIIPELSNLTNLDADGFGNVWISSLNNGVFCISKNFNDIVQSDKKIKEKIAATKVTADSLYFVTGSGSVYGASKKLNDLNLKIPPTHFLPGSKYSFSSSNTLITPGGDIFSLQGTNIFYKRQADRSFKKIKLMLHYPLEEIPTAKSINYFDSTFYISTINTAWKIKASELVNASQVSIPLASYLHKTATSNRLYQSALHKADCAFFLSKANRMLYVKNGVNGEVALLRNRTFRQFTFLGDYLLGYTDENKFYTYNVTTRRLDSLPNANLVWEAIYTINDSISIINTNKGYKLININKGPQNGKTPYNLITIENPFIPDKADYIFGDGDTYYFFKNGILSGFPRGALIYKPKPPRPFFVSINTAKKNYASGSDFNISYEDSKAIIIKIDNISFNSKELLTQYSISKNNSNHWNTITGNEISLNNLGISYGNYIIKLRSKTSASDFSQPAILILHISTPFWAKWWFIVGCVIIAMTGIFGVIRFIIWRQVRKKQQQFDSEMKYQQSEYKALNALMNPHFIFNSLNNIQSLINKDSRETANQYLVIFSKLIRQNMVNISKGFITLEQELQLVENYLNLEKLRFKNLISFSIIIDENADIDAIMIPPLLIQPLVENAIIHGLLPMQSENSRLIIKVYEKADLLHIDIEDNGIGIQQSLKRKNVSTDSYGLLNINKRIEHMKKFQKNNISFIIEELVDASRSCKGTKVSVIVELN